MDFNEELRKMIEQHDREVRNKAIDECIQKVKGLYVFTTLEEEQLDEIAEKLKEEGESK